ncbi:hypothetical protein EIP86_007939 [Pleurotus ostreatoroseus]|nr:hypothetical protein EIP86_007939 [Pleurotus ostreatoroseus]
MENSKTLQLAVIHVEPSSAHATTTDEKPRHGTLLNPTDIPASHATSSARRSESENRPLTSSNLSDTEFLGINGNVLEVVDVLDVEELQISCLDGLDVVEWPAHPTLPRLESLELSSQTNHSDFSVPSLFCGALPNLKVLKLVGLRRPWEPKAYVNLTTLHITTSSEPTEEQDIMSIFRNSPSLKELKLVIRPPKLLNSVYRRFMEKRPSGQDRYVLPRLQYVELVVQSWYAYHILSGVDLPAICRLKVRTTEIRRGKIKPEPTPADFINKVCIPGRLSKNCKIVTFTPTGLTMSADDLLFSVSRPSATDYPNFALSSMFSAFCTLELPRVNELKFRGLNWPESESYLCKTLVPCFRSLLHGAPQLRCIYLTSVSSLFISALAHIPKSPALRELYLADIRCKVRDLSFLAMGNDWSVFAGIHILFEADTMSLRAQLSCLSKAITSRRIRLLIKSFSGSRGSTDEASIELGDALFKKLGNPALNAKDDPFILPRRVLEGFHTIKLTYTGSATGISCVTVSGSKWSESNRSASLDELLFEIEGSGLDTQHLIDPLVDILNALEFPDVQKLTIEVSCAASSYTNCRMIDILSAFPAVHNLTIEGNALFLDTLASQCEADQTTVLPSLEFITFMKSTVRLPTITSICKRLLTAQEAYSDHLRLEPRHNFNILKKSTRHVIARKIKSTLTGQSSERVRDPAHKPRRPAPFVGYAWVYKCTVLIPEANPSQAARAYTKFDQRMRAQHIRVHTGCGTVLEDIYGKKVDRLGEFASLDIRRSG